MIKRMIIITRSFMSLRFCGTSSTLATADLELGSSTNSRSRRIKPQSSQGRQECRPPCLRRCPPRSEHETTLSRREREKERGERGREREREQRMITSAGASGVCKRARSPRCCLRLHSRHLGAVLVELLFHEGQARADVLLDRFELGTGKRACYSKVRVESSKCPTP